MSLFPAQCEILTPPNHAPDSLRVALLEPVEAGSAPWPRNASEQLLFAHLYETLISIDCTGNVQPSLAESWFSEGDGRQWTFRLRKDALFWDGTSVTASDVIAGWQDALSLGTVIDSVSAESERVLRVRFNRPHKAVPQELSAPMFAVTKPTGGSSWLSGTGTQQVITSGSMSNGVITTRPPRNMRGPVIRFIQGATTNARDLLDGGIDIMITAEPSVIDYAAGQERFISAPLPWDRTYVLLSPSRVQALKGDDGVPGLSRRLSRQLARDAVRGDARAYEPPSWWDDPKACAETALLVPQLAPTPLGASATPRRILFDARDAVARDLAERIVAVATADTAGSPEASAIAWAVPGIVDDAPAARGVTDRDLARSLERGDDFAYIIALPRRPANACYALRELINRAPWLAALAEKFPLALLPLVDARSHVIARLDTCGLVVDRLGNLIIVSEPLQRN